MIHPSKHFIGRVHGYDMDSPDVESSGLSSSLEEEFMIDSEEFGGFDPIIAFTTVMIECE